MRVYVFGGAKYEQMIRVPGEKRLGNPLNYARNWLPDILPACVRRTVYLDVDLTLRTDIRELHDVALGNFVVASPEFCQFKYQVGAACAHTFIICSQIGCFNGAPCFIFHFLFAAGLF